MGSLFDQQLKQKYALIYFKRNFWNKIMQAHRWALDERDILELKEMWRRKAEHMGKEGIERWTEIEEEWDVRNKMYMKSRGIAWQQGEQPEWARKKQWK